MIEFEVHGAGSPPVHAVRRRSREIAPPAGAARATTVAVIGAGFSGTLLALHLLRRCPSSVKVLLVERNNPFGRGLAYSTGNANHLLNVPAGRMSAFSDQPGHFAEWLRREGPLVCRDADDSSFIQRTVYGRYIRDLLSAELKAAGKGRLILRRGEVTGLATGQQGVALRLERGGEIEADIAILAVGNFPPEGPRIPDPSFYDTRFYRADPWAADTLTDLDPEAPVMLIGTGLTMVDTAISLLDQNHTGPIYAYSRRGLLPHRHAPGKPAALLDRCLPISVPALLRVVRAEIAQAEKNGADWRSVIDGLRPSLQDIWQSMAGSDRARFVRHLRRWWDIHRHRMPASVADRIARAMESGQLRVGAARDLDFQAQKNGAQNDGEVEVAAVLDGQKTNFRVARVINCSGPGCDYDRISDPLIRSLLKEGHIRPDPLRLGLDVTPQCALLNGQGHISRRLYAVGPATKAAFWEMTSVPDIRRQCELVANHIAGLVGIIQAQPVAHQTTASGNDSAIAWPIAPPTTQRAPVSESGVATAMSQTED